MLGIGSTELVLILFFGFLIFGPEKLPEMGRVVGRAIRQFRAASDEVNTKFKEEVYDPFQDAIDPYKDEIEKTVAPIKEDIDAINDSFRETQNVMKDPLDLKGRKKEMKEKEQELKDSFSFGSKKDDSDKTSAAGSSSKKTVSFSEAGTANKTASDAKGGAGVDVDDPFADAEPAQAPAASSNADELASLYDFDAKDGE